MKRKFDFNFNRSKDELNHYMERPSSKNFRKNENQNNDTEAAPTTTIYVGNLNYRRDEEGIKELFSKFGYVKSVQIVYKKGTELKSGIAFVQMTNKEKAMAAIESLNGKIIDDRTLKVSIANSRF